MFAGIKFLLSPRGDKIIGFLAQSDLDESKEKAKIVSLDLMTIGQEYQGQKYSEAFYCLAVAQKDVDAFVELSFIAPAIKSRLKVSKEMGLISYIGGNEEGILEKKGDEKNQARLKEIYDKFKKTFDKDEVLMEGELPEGFMKWEPECAMSKLSKEEVDKYIKQDDPLYPFFMEHLTLQEKESDGVVYPIVVTIRQQLESKT